MGHGHEFLPRARLGHFVFDPFLVRVFLGDILMSAPEGYKPIHHRPCGRTIAYVKEGVEKGMKMRAEDCLTLNGHQIHPHDPLPCCECTNGRQVSPGDLRITIED